MPRELATIRRVGEIKPIEKADRLEVACVDGWECIVKKGLFQPGDLCVYIEIDSVVPDIPYFEFMRSRKFRVRTIKMRGQLSQGLVVPITDVGKILHKELVGFKEGDDITELLKITKYESSSDKQATFIPNTRNGSIFKRSPILRYLTRYQWFRKMFKTKSKSFPSWIRKTDEPRIQNMCKDLPFLKNKIYYLTEKLDGQSGTFWFKKNKFFGFEFGICSRAVRKHALDGSNWSKVASRFNLRDKFRYAYQNHGIQLAVQGEIIGPKIQENKYKLENLDFYVFNVYNVATRKYYSYEKAKRICDEILNLKFVPVIKEDMTLTENHTIRDIIDLSVGQSVLNPEMEREGIVWRTYDKFISFKAINPEFLLNHE